MRIVIDLQSCQSGSRLGGIGRYSIELAKAMARQAGQHEMWLVLNSLLPGAIAETRHAFSDLIPQDHIGVFDSPPAISEYKNNKAKVRAAELIREDYFNSLKPDIIHIASLFEGCLEDVVTSVGQLYPGNRTAVTLYDLIPLVQRERYLGEKEILDYYLGKVENLKKAGLLLSISEFSREEAIDVLGINPGSIVNISSAADKRFKPLVIPKVQSVTLLEKYGIRRKFLMYTGSFDQRKNHVNLIKAFGLLPRKIRKDYQLVIVGNGWDVMYQQLQDVAKKSGLNQDELIFAGHVTDDELLPLYNLCSLFVFPSLAEGFGLPVLEAMSCGTPTIGSNCTSIPEVIGWPEALFDPRDPESIARKINQALTDTGFMEGLRIRGIEQAKKFSWDESARRAISAFESHNESSFRYGTHSVKSNKNLEQASSENVECIDLIEGIAELEGISALPDGALLEMAQSIESNQCQAETISAIAQGQTLKPKVGWVTTWNTRCGIASYSRYLVEHFPAEVTIFAPETSETVQPDESNVIRCWKSGTDNLHQLLSEVKQLNVEVLIVQFNYFFFDFSSFSSFLQEATSNGVRVFITFHSTHDPYDYKRLGSLKDALALCDGLIVHSMNDVTILRQLGLGHNVNYLPQGIIEKQPVAIDGLEFNDKKVIATYGFALPSKGLKEVVEAFSLLRKENGTDLHLLMVNAEYPDPRSAALIEDIRVRLKELNIEDHVTLVTEYLQDELSLGYLRHADLIVYPYQETGESSSAAVRMGIAARRPVAVTPIEIFNDVQSAVFFLPGNAPTDIAAGVRDILKLNEMNDATAIRVNESARLWISAHRYSSLSRHLYWLVAKPKSTRMNYVLPMSFDLTHASEKLCLIGSDPALKTVVGKRFGESIQTTGIKGALVYGPFLRLADGKYRARVIGEVGVGGIGSATVDVAIQKGSCVLAKDAIGQGTKQDVLAELFFTVPQGGCADLEVRVWVGDDTDLKVSMIEIAPWHFET